jgi:serine/threonine-protein kinase
MDWGLSKVALSGGAADDERVPVQTLGRGKPERITQSGDRIGTLVYMSPEQARGQTRQISARSDVFGLGAILCEILTGSPPYWGEDPLEVVRRAETGDLADACARLDASGADPELIALAKACLAPDPQQRPEDAAAVAAAITAYLDGLQARVQRQEVEKATLHARLSAVRSRVAAFLILVLAAIGAVGAGAWYKFERDAQKAAANALLDGRRRDVQQRLGEVEIALRADRLADVRAPLQAVLDRLKDGGLDELQGRAHAAQEDLALASRLEELRQQPLDLMDAMPSDDGGLPMAYQEAFRRYQVPWRDVETAAPRIAASPIKSQLLAALDHWALVERDPGTRHEILLVAEKASDPGLGRKFRNPELRRNRRALVDLAEKVDAGQCSAAEIETLALVLLDARRDAEPLLRRGLARHRNDFWLNLRLALALGLKARTQRSDEERRSLSLEGIGYARAALALRPDSTNARTVLGQLLELAGRYDEALEELSTVIVAALKEGSGALTARHALIRSLMHKGDWKAAQNACEEALRLAPYLGSLKALQQQIRQHSGPP